MSDAVPSVVSPVRRVLAGAAGALLVLPLAACSGDDTDAAPGEPPTFDTSDAPALWNPCDGLDAEAVSQAFATRFTVRRGTPTAPICTFKPDRDGGPAVDVNYQLFEGTLTDIVEQLPDPGEGSRLTAPDLPGADGARILTSVDDDTLAVTGFVRVGRLVQLVNALDPAPFARPRVTAAVRDMLAQLAAYANEQGVNTPGSTESDPESAPPHGG